MIVATDVCVIGSGSVALLSSWTLEQKLGKKIPIFTTRAHEINRISRICIDLSAYAYKALCYSVSSLPSASMELYIVCCGPLQSVQMAMRIRSFNPQAIIVILSSFSFLKDFMILYADKLTLYAYPIVSVEHSGSLVSATNHLSFALYASTLDSSLWSIISHFFGPLDFSTCNESKLAANTILTYSLYSFMYGCVSLGSVLIRRNLVISCTDSAYRLARKFGIGVDSFATSSQCRTLEDTLLNVFENYVSTLFLSNSHTFNFIHLLANRSKLKRFMQGSGCAPIC